MPAADAQRGQPAPRAAALELVQQRDDDPRAGGADRMAERDRAAVDVQPIGRRSARPSAPRAPATANASFSSTRSKSSSAEAGPLRQPANRRHRADAHDPRDRRRRSPSRESSRAASSRARGRARPTQHERGAAVGDARRGSGRDDARLAVDRAEHRRQLPQALDRRLGPRVFVARRRPTGAPFTATVDRRDLAARNGRPRSPPSRGAGSRARTRRTPRA